MRRPGHTLRPPQASIVAVMTVMVAVMTIMVAIVTVVVAVMTVMAAAEVESDGRRIAIGRTIIVWSAIAPKDRHMPSPVPIRVAVMVVSMP